MYQKEQRGGLCLGKRGDAYAEGEAGEGEAGAEGEAARSREKDTV